MDLLFGSVQIQNLKRLVGENSEEQNKISQIIFSQSYSKTYQLGGLGKTCQNQVFRDFPKSPNHLFSTIWQQCFFSLQFWSFSSQNIKIRHFRSEDFLLKSVLNPSVTVDDRSYATWAVSIINNVQCMYICTQLHIFVYVHMTNNIQCMDVYRPTGR